MYENLSLDKKLIFTVTTGRSGTKYLTSLLKLLPDITSVHEPRPRFDEVMRQVQSNPDIAYQFWVNRKLPAIRSIPTNIYAETSHLVCKGFLEPLMDMGIVPDLILLTRGKRDVALSLFQLKTIPGRTEKGCRYYLSPDDPGVLSLPDWESMHDYQLCYWYCLELERRSKCYEKSFAGLSANVAKTSVNELKSLAGFKKLVDDLKLPQLTLWGYIKYFRTRSQQINKKTRKKSKMIPDNILDLEKEVLLAVES